jgi:hypothetical protein
VWFLGGSFSTSTPERNCTVPTGTALFFPVLNAEDNPVENPPGWNPDIQGEAYVHQAVDDPIELHASLDFAIQLPPTDDLELFLFPSLAGTNYNTKPIEPVVADGYYLMLSPLPPGPHTLVFGGSSRLPFTLNVTYHLTVVPGGHGSAPPGDFNSDSFVDIRDYGAWRQTFGNSNCGIATEATNNCVVDIRAYGLWRQNFGQSGTPTATTPGAAPRR